MRDAADDHARHGGSPAPAAQHRPGHGGQGELARRPPRPSAGPRELVQQPDRRQCPRGIGTCVSRTREKTLPLTFSKGGEHGGSNVEARVDSGGRGHRPALDRRAGPGLSRRAAREPPLGEHRPGAWGPLDGGRGQRRPAVRVLLRCDGRRAVEVHRRRHHLAARHGPSDRQLVGRRGPGVRGRPRRRLHRHRRDPAPRQHPAGRRRVPLRRRRRDVDASRARGGSELLADPDPSDRLLDRLGRGLRQALGAQRRARRLQDDRRGPDVAAGPVPGRPHGRGRHLDGARQPRRPVRRAVGGVAQVVGDELRRPGQRPLQVRRRRRDVERDHARARDARGRRRQDRRRGVPGRSGSRVGARRERGGRRLPLRRRGPDLGARQRAARPAPARVLLHPRVRRPAGPGRDVRPEHRLLPVDRRRGDLQLDRRAARRQPRPVDLVDRPGPDDRVQRRRRQRVAQRR